MGCGFTGPSHGGHIDWENTFVEGFGNNGMYHSGSGQNNNPQEGTIHHLNNYHRDNTPSNYRPGTTGSVIEKCVSIVNDPNLLRAPYPGGPGRNARGAWVRHCPGQEIRDSAFYHRSDQTTNPAVQATLQNSDVCNGAQVDIINCEFDADTRYTSDGASTITVVSQGNNPTVDMMTDGVPLSPEMAAMGGRAVPPEVDQPSPIDPHDPWSDPILDDDDFEPDPGDPVEGWDHIATMDDLNGRVLTSAWKPDSTQFVIAGQDGNAHLYDRSGAGLSDISTHGNGITEPVWGADWSDEYIAYACGNGDLTWYDGESRTIDHTDDLGVTLRSARFNEDGSVLAVGTDDNTVILIDTSDFETIDTLDHGTGDVNLGIFDLSWAGGLLAASSWSSGFTAIWDGDEEIERFTDGSGAHRANAMTDDYLAYGGSDNLMWVRDTDDWNQLSTSPVSTPGLWAIDASNQPRFFAYGGFGDSNTYVRDGDLSNIATLSQATDTIETVRFSPAMDRLLYGSRDSNAFLHETPPALKIDTLDADQITVESARLRGELIDLGPHEDVDVYFQWRPVDNGDWNETDPETLSDTGEFDALIEELEPTTSYEFRSVGDDE